MRAEVASGRAGGWRGHGQRRERRPGRPGDGTRWCGPRRAVRGHALARAQRGHGRPGPLHRRGRRGLRRTGAAGRRGGRRGHRPGPDRDRPRPRVRQAGRAQLDAAGRPAPGFPADRAGRRRSPCWWARQGRASSAVCWRTRTGSRGPPRAGTTATLAVAALAAAAGAWCVRVHAAAANADAVRVAARWRQAAAARTGPDRKAPSQLARAAGHDARTGSTLRGLRARGYHGVFEHERADGQEFVVDAVLWTRHERGGGGRRPGRTLTTARWPAGWRPS